MGDFAQEPGSLSLSLVAPAARKVYAVGAMGARAQVVLPCGELNETLGFFTDRLGFRVDAIYPADEPSVAVVSGYGLRIELKRGGSGEPGVLRLLASDPSAFGASVLTAPNGTRIEIVDADPPLVVPPVVPSFVLSENGDRARWGTGRAGMRYRDLVPDRQGGASSPLTSRSRAGVRSRTTCTSTRSVSR